MKVSKNSFSSPNVLTTLRWLETWNLPSACSFLLTVMIQNCLRWKVSLARLLPLRTHAGDPRVFLVGSSSHNFCRDWDELLTRRGRSNIQQRVQKCTWRSVLVVHSATIILLRLLSGSSNFFTFILPNLARNENECARWLAPLEYSKYQHSTLIKCGENFTESVKMYFCLNSYW